MGCMSDNRRRRFGHQDIVTPDRLNSGAKSAKTQTAFPADYIALAITHSYPKREVFKIFTNRGPGRPISGGKIY
jgi:hypothetical protein